MSRYGVTVFGTDTYGELARREFDASPFRVVCTDYGTAQVSWQTIGGDYSIITLVRSTTGIPISPHDGVEISITDLDQRLSVDTGLTPGRWYYYALFVFAHQTRQWIQVGAGDVLVTADHGGQERLYHRIPPVLRTASDPTARLIDTTNASGGTTRQTITPTEERDTFLYRFLGVLGFELDTERTYLEALRQLTDPREAAERVLGALAAQLGVAGEPSLSATALRRRTAAAARLDQLRATIPGVELLAETVTGWEAQVAIGWNMALDNLDAAPASGGGRWRLLLHNSAGSCIFFTNATSPPPTGGGGAWRVRSTDGSTVIIAARPANTTLQTLPGRERILYAIPVQPGDDHNVSVYWYDVNGHSPKVRVDTTYLDLSGNQLLTQAGINSHPLTANWATGLNRVGNSTTAPPEARFLEVTMRLIPQTGDDTIAEFVGFQVQRGPVTDWQCAREVIVSLYADHVNEILHPNPQAGGAAHWFNPNSQPIDVSVTPDADITFRCSLTGSDANPAVYPGDDGTEKLPIQDGEVYRIQAEVQTPTAGRTCELTVLQLRGDTVVGTQILTFVSDIPADQWARMTATLHGTSDFDNVVVYLQWHRGTGAAFINGDHLFWRRVSAVLGHDDATYFDGDSSTTTSDYLWENEAGGSRSHQYVDRNPKSTRLRALLRDYLPPQACFILRFAIPRTSIYAPVDLMKSFDTTPESTVTTSVGATGIALWNDLHL